MHRLDAIDHLGDERIGRRQTDVQGLVVIMLDRGIDGVFVRLVQPVARGFFRLAFSNQAAGARFHGQDGRARMPRHVEGGNDLDLARFGRLENLDVIGAGQMAGCGGDGVGADAQKGHLTACLSQIMAAAGADPGQLGQAVDLEPPAFVIAQMQMKLVELDGRHLFDDSKNLGLGMEIARHVDHQAAKTKARSIFDFQGPQTQVFVSGLLGKRAQGIRGAGGIGGGDGNRAVPG